MAASPVAGPQRERIYRPSGNSPSPGNLSEEPFCESSEGVRLFRGRGLPLGRTGGLPGKWGEILGSPGSFHSTKRVAGPRAISVQQAAGARNPEQKRVSARV